MLITGGNGFLGRSVIEQLCGAGRFAGVEHVVSADIRLPADGDRIPNVSYELCDVTDAAALPPLLRMHRITTVIHLASIVNPGKQTTEAQEYAVDVTGSRNTIDACLTEGVQRIIVSSSGAAYGYHADNPEWLTESDPLRGNDEFSYSKHKRLVEEMLAECGEQHPELEQSIFRIGTILGEGLQNQITALFDAKRVLAIAGSDSPYVFIWHSDVAAVLAKAVTSPVTGIFNVAGTGALTIQNIAARMGKRNLTLPAWLLSAGLTVGHALRLTPHTAARVNFVRYRPVLSNAALIERFGYTPSKTSAEAFEAFRASR
ncbi:NAD-dependent epimerase/dehydratase family protein [Leucobacter viscericola]|uniref:NAD-dependent epimerase/dehydratase family protein n=1 Tax=Leucobacter viscericola TaxID=2714935 RepID=A0A6G7XJ54_9MICO|nr:NAD-dependent epimerase/dehydratase family protein [Leucobacter viscericola]